jgi:hypothetical protein
VSNYAQLIVTLSIVCIVGFDAVWVWRWLRAPATLKRSDHVFYLAQNVTLAALILIAAGPGQWIVGKAAAAVLGIGLGGLYLIVSAAERKKKRAE